MSRQMLTTLVDGYKAMSDKVKFYDDQKKEMAKQIKEFMKENDIQEIETDKCKATYKPSSKVTVNEEKLIQNIKDIARKTKDKELKAKIRKAVVKVEAIDEQYLETLIYDGFITSEQIQDSYETKQTWTLRCSNLKK